MSTGTFFVDFVVDGSQNPSDQVVGPCVLDVSLDGIVGLHGRVLLSQELVVSAQGVFSVGMISHLSQSVRVERALEVQIYLVVVKSL